jgi:hypothetical protein
MKKSSLIFLVLANLVPISGILFFDWDVFSILFFYWLESAVVGVFNVAKMLTIKPAGNHKLSGVIFFIIHYSAFMFGHGLFIFELFSPVEIKATTVLLAVVSLTISHGYSFITNYIGRKENEKVSISEQMVAPYSRIMVMHVTIIFCAFIINLFSTARVILILLIVLKVVIDVVAHIREHTRIDSYTTEHLPLAIREEAIE